MGRIALDKRLARVLISPFSQAGIRRQDFGDNSNGRGGMSRATLGLVALLGLFLASGCASNDVPDFDSIKEVQDISASGASRLPLRLAVAPITQSFDRKEINVEGTNRWVVPYDPRELRLEFMEVLRQYGIFEDVLAVDGDDIYACIDTAFEDEFDLVMEIDLKQFDVSYEGTNGWYAPNLINFALFVWTAWWVADEKYGANLEMDMTLWSAHSGQPLIAPYNWKHTAVRELDDFERGWKLTGSIFIPGALKADNWKKISDVTMPFTMQWAKKELLLYMHEVLRDYATDTEDDFADRMSKRMAVVVGVNRHEDYLIHNLRYADDDAKAFTAFLEDPYRGNVPPKNIMTLENHLATRENILKAFERISTYCREDDTVYVFFAGYGAVVKDEMAGGDGYRKYLILADTVVDDLTATALSIDELDSILDGLPARNVIIVMDTSFSQPGETRTYVDVRKPPEEYEITDEYLKKLTDKEGRIVLAACGIDEGALMLDEEQQGLFTHYLIEATRPGQAIEGDDGVLTLHEALAYATPAVEDRADIEGQPQAPVVLGAGTESIELVNLSDLGPPPEEEPDEGAPDVDMGEEPLEEDLPGDDE